MRVHCLSTPLSLVPRATYSPPRVGTLVTLQPPRTTSLLQALLLSFSPTLQSRTMISTHAPLPRPGVFFLASLSPYTRTPCARPPSRSPRTSGIGHPPHLCGSSNYLCPLSQSGVWCRLYRHVFPTPAGVPLPMHS